MTQLPSRIGTIFNCTKVLPTSDSFQLAFIVVASLFIVNLALAGNAITTINADSLYTSYNHNTGIFLIEGQGVGLEIKRQDNTNQTYSNVSINLSMNLLIDTSSGGLASGKFFNGSFSLYDNDASIDLLTGTIDSLTVQEVYHNFGFFVVHQFTSSGLIKVTNGDLLQDFETNGKITSLQYSISGNPNNLTNDSFAALTKLTLIPTPEPIPEPGTLCLLALTIPIMAGRKKHKQFVV